MCNEYLRIKQNNEQTNKVSKNNTHFEKIKTKQNETKQKSMRSSIQDHLIGIILIGGCMGKVVNSIPVKSGRWEGKSRFAIEPIHS